MMNVMYFFMLFVGTIFFVTYGGKPFETSNEIMINFILNELPIGVVGLVVAAVFAAAMSSVDSLLNSMTTVFTKDIARAAADVVARSGSALTVGKCHSIACAAHSLEAVISSAAEVLGEKSFHLYRYKNSGKLSPKMQKFTKK